MILVTGASGLVGSAVLDGLKKAGKRAVGTCFSQCPQNLSRLDLTSRSSVYRFFGSHDITSIIHCSAVIPAAGPSGDAGRAYAANLDMIHNLLETISLRTNFTFISTTALYDLTGTGGLTEKSPFCCNTPYQESKAACEKALNLFFRDTGQLCILRISSPYSIDTPSPGILERFIQSSLTKKQITLWGTGQRCQAFTNVTGLAKAINRLMDENVSGTFNYVTTSSISMLELAQKIKAFRPETTITIQQDKKDPEENCRTTIDTQKIQQFVAIEDTLEPDIRAMGERRVQ